MSCDRVRLTSEQIGQAARFLREFAPKSTWAFGIRRDDVRGAVHDALFEMVAGRARIKPGSCIEAFSVGVYPGPFMNRALLAVGGGAVVTRVIRVDQVVRRRAEIGPCQASSEGSETHERRCGQSAATDHIRDSARSRSGVAWNRRAQSARRTDPLLRECVSRGEVEHDPANGLGDARGDVDQHGAQPRHLGSSKHRLT